MVSSGHFDLGKCHQLWHSEQTSRRLPLTSGSSRKTPTWGGQAQLGQRLSGFPLGDRSGHRRLDDRLQEGPREEVELRRLDLQRRADAGQILPVEDGREQPHGNHGFGGLQRTGDDRQYLGSAGSEVADETLEGIDELRHPEPG